MTEASEQLEKARENIDDAVKALGKIVIDKVWGYDDFSEKIQTELKEALMLLINMRDNL